MAIISIVPLPVHEQPHQLTWSEENYFREGGGASTGFAVLFREAKISLALVKTLESLVFDRWQVFW